jgi:hypothetical protein
VATHRVGGGRLKRQRNIAASTEPSTPTHNWGRRPPPNIPQRVKDQVRRRDKTCRLQYDGCTQRIEELDHVIGLAEQGLTRTPVVDATMIQGACSHCHAIKSERQRLAGLARYHERRAAAGRRPAEPHPGLL